MTRSTLALVALALATLAASAPASAQGAIAGTIVDPATDFPIITASVLVIGTTRGAATVVDGKYRIEGLRPGDYTLRVSYVGYQTKEFTGIAVVDGQTTTLDIELEEAVLGTEGEVIVVGDVENGAAPSEEARVSYEVLCRQHHRRRLTAARAQAVSLAPEPLPFG